MAMDRKNSKPYYMAWDNRFFRLQNPYNLLQALCEEYKPAVGFMASSHLIDVIEDGYVISEEQFKREIVAMQRPSH